MIHHRVHQCSLFMLRRWPALLLGMIELAHEVLFAKGKEVPGSFREWALDKGVGRVS